VPKRRRLCYFEPDLKLAAPRNPPFLPEAHWFNIAQRATSLSNAKTKTHRSPHK
jgi:hypothetical protein